MNADDYQEQAGRTLVDEPGFALLPKEVMISWNALGLAGEAGEVADLVKKGIYHRKGVDRDKLEKELGDVLWYVSALCRNFDLRLFEVMKSNIDKLRARYPGGWNAERSHAPGQAPIEEVSE